MNTIETNLKTAIDILKSIPEENVNLNFFKSSCGTIACAAGWLASDPFFTAQGMILEKDIHDKSYRLVRDAAVGVDDGFFDWLNEMFGFSAFDRLFIERDEGRFDHAIYQITNNCELSDKQLVVERFQYQLNVLSGLVN
jgi:hypothetical protein